MKLNWKVRFKNKIFLSSFLGLLVSFIFSMLKLFDIVPTITENEILKIVANVLTFLGLIGVINDPTTSGLGDSERALSYDKPWDDNEVKEEIVNEED